jgi:hypothetical protein
MVCMVESKYEEIQCTNMSRFKYEEIQFTSQLEKNTGQNVHVCVCECVCVCHDARNESIMITLHSNLE